LASVAIFKELQNRGALALEKQNYWAPVSNREQPVLYFGIVGDLWVSKVVQISNEIGAKQKDDPLGSPFDIA
jgi:hypothetical protein